MDKDMDMQEYIDQYCTPKDIENYEDFVNGVLDDRPENTVKKMRAWAKINFESFLSPIGNN